MDMSPRSWAHPLLTGPSRSSEPATTAGPLSRFSARPLFIASEVVGPHGMRLRLTGSLTSRTLATLKHAVHNLLAQAEIPQEGMRLQLCLGQLRHVDKAGLATLIALCAQCRKHGVTLSLQETPAALRSLITRAGLHVLIELDEEP